MEAMRADVESGVLSMVENVKGKASEFRTAFDEMLDVTGIGDAMSKLGSVVGSGLSTVKGALESFGSEAVSALAMPFNGLPEKIFGSFKGQNPFAPDCPLRLAAPCRVLPDGSARWRPLERPRSPPSAPPR